MFGRRTKLQKQFNSNEEKYFDDGYPFLPRPLKQSAPDVVVGQRVPEVAHLVSVPPQAATNDGVHVERGHLLWVLGNHVAQLVPELMVGLAVFRDKVGVVDALGKDISCLVESKIRLS